jgi:hypothetical protein
MKQIELPKSKKRRTGIKLPAECLDYLKTLDPKDLREFVRHLVREEDTYRIRKSKNV